MAPSSKPSPIVLAYSGSAATTLAIRWLAEQHRADVVTVTLDVGQGQELEAVRDRALAAGAVRAHVLDAREELARDYILPSLQADATDRSGHPLVAALALPVIAAKLVEIAAIEQARTVAHGSLGAAAGHPLQAAIHSLNPALGIVTASGGGIPEPARVVHVNLWGRAAADNTTDSLPAAASRADVEAAFVDVTFEHGVPVGLNGVTLPLVDLITSLSTLARRHGAGRFVQPSQVEGFSRWICEAPAAVALHLAHRELQSLVTSSDLHALCNLLRAQYEDAVERGLWFTPLRQALQAFTAKVQERVTGAVRLKLLNGSCEVVTRSSPLAASDAAPVLVHH